MAEWRYHGSERKEIFEKYLAPDEMAYELIRYQKELGKVFGVRELLELHKIRALAFVAQSICDAPEFFMDCYGIAEKSGVFQSIPDAIESLTEAIIETT